MASPKGSTKKSQKKTSKKPKPGPKALNRRSRVKYSALDPTYNLKTRADEINDIREYAKTIPDDMVDPKSGKLVKEWLNSFAEEHINANFKHKGVKIMKKVKEKRERYRANNRRNQDIYTKEKAQGKLNYIEDAKDTFNPDNAQDGFDVEEQYDENKGFYFWEDNKDEPED